MENYKECEYLPDGYLISNLGNIKNKNGLILKQQKSNSGYKSINIKNNNRFIHRAIAFAFIPKINGKNFINHKNGNKEDNRIENLEWCTRSENVQHCYDNGLKKYKPLHYKGMFGSEHNRSVKIICEGVIYHGYSEASRALNIPISTVHYRVNSNLKKWMHFEIGS